MKKLTLKAIVFAMAVSCLAGCGTKKEAEVVEETATEDKSQFNYEGKKKYKNNSFKK